MNFRRHERGLQEELRFLLNQITFEKDSFSNKRLSKKCILEDFAQPVTVTHNETNIKEIKGPFSSLKRMSMFYLLEIFKHFDPYRFISFSSYVTS